MRTTNPVHISSQIQSNIFGRDSREVEVTHYEVIYKEEVVITTRDENHDEVTVEDENIKKIALEVREKGKRIKGAYIDYLKEENYAIITLLADEGYGSVVGEYLYANNKYLQIDTPNGDIEQVIYYK